MMHMFLLCGCISLIGVCFYAASKSGGSNKKSTVNDKRIPKDIQKAFKSYIIEIMAEKGILLKTARITAMHKIEEIPHQSGCFVYALLDILLEPAIENTEEDGETQGLILNTRELLSKAGIKDDIIVLYFREENEEEEPECYEISFIPGQRAKMQGYKAYVEKRYKDVAEKWPMPGYEVKLNGCEVALWDNLAEKELFDIPKTRTKAKEEFAYYAQYVDVYEDDDIEIKTWIQFERKKELVFSIRCKSYKAETPAGIRVGSTVEHIKEAYGNDLAYLDDFQGEGPAYGYIPADDTNRYIAFKAENGIITEILITDGFDGRIFIPKDGYVDQDIPWIEVDYSEKLTEKFGRELYLGQHKMEADVRQVFNTFVTNNFEPGSVLEKGLWKEYEGGRECKYYLICRGTQEGEKIFAEIRMKKISIETFTSATDIWVVSHYRKQERRG